MCRWLPCLFHVERVSATPFRIVAVVVVLLFPTHLPALCLNNGQMQPGYRFRAVPLLDLQVDGYRTSISRSKLLSGYSYRVPTPAESPQVLPQNASPNVAAWSCNSGCPCPLPFRVNDFPWP